MQKEILNFLYDIQSPLLTHTNHMEILSFSNAMLLHSSLLSTWYSFWLECLSLLYFSINYFSVFLKLINYLKLLLIFSSITEVSSTIPFFPPILCLNYTSYMVLYLRNYKIISSIKLYFLWALECQTPQSLTKFLVYSQDFIILQDSVPHGLEGLETSVVEVS